MTLGIASLQRTDFPAISLYEAKLGETSEGRGGENRFGSPVEDIGVCPEHFEADKPVPKSDISMGGNARFQ